MEDLELLKSSRDLAAMTDKEVDAAISAENFRARVYLLTVQAHDARQALHQERPLAAKAFLDALALRLDDLHRELDDNGLTLTSAEPCTHWVTKDGTAHQNCPPTER